MENLEIKVGDRVFFKPEWMDAGDERYDFRAVEVFPDHVLVQAANSTMTYKPIHSVKNYMIERTER